MEAGGLPPRWGAYARLAEAASPRYARLILRLPGSGEELEMDLLKEALEPRWITVQSRPDAIGHQHAILLIESFQRFPVQDITSGIMMAALDTRQRFQLSYWDAAIIEASRAMGCMQVLSEDLNDGQDYSGVRVANPFR